MAETGALIHVLAYVVSMLGFAAGVVGLVLLGVKDRVAKLIGVVLIAVGATMLLGSALYWSLLATLLAAATFAIGAVWNHRRQERRIAFLRIQYEDQVRHGDDALE